MLQIVYLIKSTNNKIQRIVYLKHYYIVKCKING